MEKIPKTKARQTNTKKIKNSDRKRNREEAKMFYKNEAALQKHPNDNDDPEKPVDNKNGALCNVKQKPNINKNNKLEVEQKKLNQEVKQEETVNVVENCAPLSKNAKKKLKKAAANALKLKPIRSKNDVADNSNGCDIASNADTTKKEIIFCNDGAPKINIGMNGSAKKHDPSPAKTNVASNAAPAKNNIIITSKAAKHNVEANEAAKNNGLLSNVGPAKNNNETNITVKKNGQPNSVGSKNTVLANTGAKSKSKPKRQTKEISNCIVIPKVDYDCEQKLPANFAEWKRWQQMLQKRIDKNALMDEENRLKHIETSTKAEPKPSKTISKRSAKKQNSKSKKSMESKLLCNFAAPADEPAFGAPPCRRATAKRKAAKAKNESAARKAIVENLNMVVENDIAETNDHLNCDVSAESINMCKDVDGACGYSHENKDGDYDFNDTCLETGDWLEDFMNKYTSSETWEILDDLGDICDQNDDSPKDFNENVGDNTNINCFPDIKSFIDVLANDQLDIEECLKEDCNISGED